MSGLYLHIPFCKQACSYCDFYFVTRQEKKQRFVDELVKEIRSKNGTRFTQDKIQTIYFGGGTPSLLSANQVEEILEAIDEAFTLDLEEVTLEMNPDDVSRRYLSELLSAGITRASMGIQTFDEELLRFMNRTHTRQEALECLEDLSNSGFKSFTVDLIYGNLNQTLEILEEDVNTLLEFNPPHISAYSLTIEPRTRLGKQLELGRIVEPDDEIVSAHFDLVEKKLRDVGINQYEISNFAKDGYEAKHNSAYWNHENYLGFGPGAHSFWWDESGLTAQRWNNNPDLNSYLESNWEKKNEIEELNLAALAEERLILGLRTVHGISLEELKSRYSYVFKEKHQVYIRQKERENKLVLDEDSLRLTKKGLKISDAILLDLVSLV